jgi:hypothetical protein
LITPKSWQINASLIRDFSIDDKLTFRIKGGAGVTNKQGSHLFSLLFNGSAATSSSYNDNYQLQIGPQLQWLYSGEIHRVMASYEYSDDPNAANKNRQVAQIEWSYLLSNDWQLRAKLAERKQDSLEQKTTQLTLLHYF